MEATIAHKKPFAIVVSDRRDSLDELKTLLKSQGMEIWSACSCAEVARLLDQTHPELIFTATRLSDGTWMNIVKLTEQALVPTDVIVVGKFKDTTLYLDTMDRGAADFIIPPFEFEAMNHVVRVAAEDVRRQRIQQAIRAVA